MAYIDSNIHAMQLELKKEQEVIFEGRYLIYLQRSSPPKLQLTQWMQRLKEILISFILCLQASLHSIKYFHVVQAAMEGPVF